MPTKPRFAIWQGDHNTSLMATGRCLSCFERCLPFVISCTPSSTTLGVQLMSRLCLLAVLSAGLILSSTRADDKKSQTIKGWRTVVDPDGDCRVTEDNGKLT